MSSGSDEPRPFRALGKPDPDISCRPNLIAHCVARRDRLVATLSAKVLPYLLIGWMHGGTFRHC